MTNSASFTTEELIQCFGSAASHLAPTLVVTGVSTDTRTLQPGNVFVALRGESFDGHHHVHTALGKGAVVCIVEDDNDEWPRQNIVRVSSTLHALGTFGWFHRKRFDIPVIAIAGSAGKTSTKELAAHVLSTVHNVLKTEANYNNRIGTPATLLLLNESHTAAVIEIGTNEPGEIETLSAMVQPTHGLITQIGKEHLEKLGNIDGVEQEETALFDYLRDTDGVILVNADDERLARWYERHGGRGMSFGVEREADISVDLAFDERLHPILHMVGADGGMRAVMQTTGYAAGLNAVAVVAVAKVVGMDAWQIKRALESYAPAPSHGYARMVIEQLNDVVVLNDTYNANPESMVMALRTLAGFTAPQRIAVLGDMRELGSTASEEHREILREAVSVAAEVVVFGTEFASAAIGHPSVHVCHSHGECAAVVSGLVTKGRAVLVKGSRGLTMELVISELRTLICSTT